MDMEYNFVYTAMIARGYLAAADTLSQRWGFYSLAERNLIFKNWVIP